MKKHLRTLFLTICCLSIALAGMAAAESMTWREYEVELNEIKNGGMFAPADMKDNEYCVTVEMTLPEELAADSDLTHAMYEEILLTDLAGNTYAAGASLSKDLTKSFLFAVPETVAMEDLTVSFGASADSGEAEAALGDPGAPVTITLESGDTIILTPAEAADFAGQDDSISVRTRIGSTNHNGGSIFLEGSSLPLMYMRDTKQYEQPRVAFTYETALEKDAATDAIGEIGANAVLRADGAEYTPALAWITDNMACYIFDCEALPEGLPSFTTEDGKLVIGF